MVRGAGGTLVVVVLLALLSAGGLAWLRGQWYVGQDEGRVALFQGVATSVAGRPLSRVDVVSELDVSELPPVPARRVAAGIATDDRAQAMEVVRRLGAQAADACRAEQERAAAQQPQVPVPPGVLRAEPATEPCPGVGEVA